MKRISFILILLIISFVCYAENIKELRKKLFPEICDNEGIIKISTSLEIKVRKTGIAIQRYPKSIFLFDCNAEKLRDILIELYGNPEVLTKEEKYYIEKAKEAVKNMGK